MSCISIFDEMVSLLALAMHCSQFPTEIVLIIRNSRIFATHEFILFVAVRTQFGFTPKSIYAFRKERFSLNKINFANYKRMMYEIRENGIFGNASCAPSSSLD